MADKQLETTTAASAFQKQWFADLRRRVFDERQPYALLQADVPFELFDLLEIPAVSNQWWASIIAAKRQAPAVSERDGCRRSSRWPVPLLQSGLRVDAVSGAGEAPWGGLPTPRLLCARLTCDCIHRVFELWAEAFGAELFEIDHPGAGELPPNAGGNSAGTNGGSSLNRTALRSWLSTLESLVERLEAISGRAFDRNALRERLELVNQQEEVFDDVRRLIATAPECPVRMTEQITNVMATQWVRGSEWAIAHARAFRDEVQQRVDAGVAACPGERARLMWVGAGLWHDTGFYTAFESSHRAVFVWSMYLAFGPGRLHSLRTRRSDGGAGQPNGQLQRVPAQPALGRRVARPPGARTPDQRCAGPPTAKHETGGHRPPLHRACARGRRHSGAADRGGCRRCSCMGCRRGAR